MSYIELKHIKKSFDDKEILKDVSLSIQKGEFVTFLGSSGCGKTTLLRCIAGLESVNSGNIYLDGTDITHTDVKKRGISMIFQQHCLFPTMTVYDNVSFGLRMNHTSSDEIKERVNEVLHMVNMQEHSKKYPYQLSGGEQQRAGLARGLVMNPKVLLLDEPFSAIDAKLRKELQIYLRKTHEKMGMTTIFVTHDQEEAMRISDTIHLFNDGGLEQSDSPNSIYLHPKTVYVASFIGSYNLIKKKNVVQDANEDVTLAIRPELIEIANESFPKQEDYLYITGIVSGRLSQGSMTRFVVMVNNAYELNVDVMSMEHFPFGMGDKVFLRIPWNAIESLTR